VRATLGRLYRYLLLTEASTRSSALLRIGIVALLWCKWGGDFLLFLDKPTDQRWIGFSFYVSTFLMFFGIATRVSALWTAATMLAIYYWMGFHDGVEPYTHHHTGLLCVATALIALTPCGVSWSFDRWLAVRRASRRGEAPPPERAPVWGLRLVALQVSVLYLSTSFDKLNVAFLSGVRLQHHAMSLYLGSDYPTSPAFPWVTQAFAILTVLCELGLAFGLWIPRARWFLIPVGIVFHAILYVTLPVSTFSLTMWLLYLAFLDPDTVHHFLEHGETPPKAVA
jgi:hypothetical protein